jgi:hypothetical protein
MTFDISKRRALETAEIQLNNGDGAALVDDDGNRLSATLFGPASKQWQQADAERNRRQLARAEKSPRKVAAAIADGKREDDNHFLASITVSFNGWTYPHPDAASGGTWPTQRDMFKACYEDGGYAYIRDQLLKEGEEHTAFTKGSQSN